MKTEQPILITTITAGDILSKGTCVGYDGKSVAEAEVTFGIVNADTSIGEECPVMVLGIALCITGGAITAGNFVKTGDDGVIDASAAPTFNNYLVGVALDDATAAGELVRVKLF